MAPANSTGCGGRLHRCGPARRTPSTARSAARRTGLRQSRSSACNGPGGGVARNHAGAEMVTTATGGTRDRAAACSTAVPPIEAPTSTIGPSS